MGEDPSPHVYDAIKRREYYLRNRKLKGRTPGSIKPPTARLLNAVKPPVKTKTQQQADLRKQQEAKITALKGRLEKLRAVLAEETKKAQTRSGVKSSKSTAGQMNSSSKKLTPAQKAKAALAAKDYRKKHKDDTLEDQVKTLTEKIKTIQERIVKMRNNGSVGARRTTAK